MRHMPDTVATTTIEKTRDARTSMGLRESKDTQNRMREMDQLEKQEMMHNFTEGHDVNSSCGSMQRRNEKLKAMAAMHNTTDFLNYNLDMSSKSSMKQNIEHQRIEDGEVIFMPDTSPKKVPQKQAELASLTKKKSNGRISEADLFKYMRNSQQTSYHKEVAS
mmetsp:Transcript_4852/g.7302  ORF Transcript_4852/g.7302 Transcript_4852/m.7302 type:complete len:163 (-) Transcript_4852:657-1145(-)